VQIKEYPPSPPQDHSTAFLTGTKQSIKRSRLVVEPYARFLEWRTRTTRTFAFVATTGRSGTTTLSDLFTGLPQCIALHEPYPCMLSDWPTGLDLSTESASKAIAEFHRSHFQAKKRINILRAAAGHTLYLETNHQFVKNFANPAIDYFGDRLRVIHLVRNPVSVATSFYAIDSIPGRPEMGRLYMIDPRQRDNVLPINDVLEGDPDFSHDLYRCLWYWYETEARVIRLEATHPRLPVIHLDTNDLNDPQRLLELVSFLDVDELRDDILARAGRRTNEKLAEKHRAIDRAEAESMNERLRQLLLHRFGPGLLPRAATSGHSS